jgi:hypothetical protein
LSNLSSRVYGLEKYFTLPIIQTYKHYWKNDTIVL